MNILDALRIWNEYTEHYIGGHGELSAAAIVINDLVTAYDDLAPNWNDAPNDARAYTISASGLCKWHTDDPHRTPNMTWYSKSPKQERIAGHVALALGIDWRLCKWSRTEA